MPLGKRITDEEFKGWQQMSSVRQNIWIYFSPDGVLAALVDETTKRVLLVQERKSKGTIYEDKENMRMAARRTHARRVA